MLGRALRSPLIFCAIVGILLSSAPQTAPLAPHVAVAAPSTAPVLAPLAAPSTAPVLAPLAAPSTAPVLAPLASQPAPPPDAHSTSLPAASADDFRQQYEAQHTLTSIFDGSFSSVQTSVYAAGPFHLSGAPANSPLLRLPVGVNYVEMDVRIDSAGTTAGVSIRAVGATEWRWKDFVSPTGTTPVYATRRVFLGQAETQWEMVFYCWGGTPNCTVSNVRFGSDVPGWSYRRSTDWFQINGPDISPVHASVQTTTLHGIAPQDGPFLALQVPQDDWFHASQFIDLQSPIVQLPAFSTTQTLTLGLDWARTLTTTVGLDETASGIQVFFAPLNGQPWAHMLTINNSGVSTGWQHIEGELFPTTLSGQRGRIVLRKYRGFKQHVFALDSLTFSLDGQPYQIPADQLVGKCNCEVGGQVQRIFGDPVNTYSGSAYLQVTDLTVPSGGPALDFERTYVSMFADSATYPTTALGPGWRHSFGAALTLPSQTGGEANTVIYEAPSGNRLRFFDDGTSNTALEPAPGVRASLMRVAGVYTLTLRDQTSLQFNAQGRLTQQRDPQGHVQTLTYYAAPGQTWDGQLEEVIDAATQRTLTFTYTTVSSLPRLLAVSDPLNNMVEFSYTSHGDLATVTDLRGGVTTYDYSGSTHLLTTIQDPLLVTRLTNTYDSQRRVTQQLDASGLVMTFAYTTTADGPVTTITQQHPGMPADVLVDHYRLDGSLRFQERNGQFVGYVTFDRSLAPTVHVDANGQATELANNSVGLPTQLTDATGRISTITYGIDHQPVQIVGVDSITTTATYDVAGNLTQMSSAGSDTLRQTSAYTYTTDNRLLEQRPPDGVVTRHAYDMQGQVISTTVGYGTSLGQTTSYGYDTLGRVVTTTIGLGTTLARTDVTHYNADHTVHETIQGYVDGVFDPQQPDADVITTYGYDLLGRPAWVRDALSHSTVTHYDAAGRVNWTARNYVATGWSGGSLPATPPAYDMTHPDANIATFYGYDALGRTELVTETGILTGTFDPVTLQFSSTTERVTHTQYDGLSRPVTTTLNYRPGLPASADTNVQMLTYYDGAGSPIWQRDALGRWTRMEYDALSRPITTTLNYENGDPLMVDLANTSWTDGNDTDLISVTHYDTAGRLDRQIQNFVNGAFTATEPITDQITLYQYDSLSRPITTTFNYAPGETDAALNRVSATAYDLTTGRLLGRRDELGRWSSQQYDLLGHVTMSIQNCRNAQGTQAAGGCATFDQEQPDRNVPTTTHYDELGRAYESVNALGQVSHINYDRLGRAVTTIQNYAVGAPTTAITNVTTLAAYDALGATTVMTDALGYATYSIGNGLGQTIVVTDTMGRATRMGYDGMGGLRWSERHDGQLTVYQVDGLGRTTATIVNYADGVVGLNEPTDQDLIMRTIYDLAGRPIQAIDAAGRVTAFAYDLQDRLIAVTENAASGTCATPPCNVLTQYQYDRIGNRTAIVDARGNIRRFAYDAASQPTAATDALGQITEWEYEASGRVAVQRDPRGSAYDLTYTYDDLDHLTQTSATNLGTIGAEYDALGRRVSLSDATGITTFRYDALGQITQIQAPQTGIVGYTYDARGQRTQLTYPDGAALDYVYRSDGQLQRVSQDGTTLASYSYDTIGRPQDVARLNGARTRYQYDSADRLRALTMTANGATVSDYQYEVNRLGMRTAVSETLPLSNTFTTTPAALGFLAPTAYVAGQTTVETLADLNDDGKLDLVTRDSGVIGVLLRADDGGFEQPVFYDNEYMHLFLTVGDLNGDDAPDIVTGDTLPMGMSVFLNNGDGTFQAGIHYDGDEGNTGFHITYVALGDVNEDSKPDLVAAHPQYNSIALWLGNGDGTFQAVIALSDQTDNSEVALADLNADQHLDLMLLSETNIRIRLGNGNGTFQTATQQAVSGGYASRLIVRDLNGDTILDLVAGTTSGVSVLRGNGNGTFQTAVGYPLLNGAQAIATGDVDDDGALDLIASHSSDGIVSVLLGDGEGTFRAPVTTTVPHSSGRLAVGELNGDRMLDVVLSGSSLSASNAAAVVLLGRGDGTFVVNRSFAAGTNPTGIVTADLNGDTKLDLAVTNTLSNSLSVLLARGDGTFQSSTHYAVGAEPLAIVQGDFDDDNSPDLAVTNTLSDSVSVLLGNGDGTLQTATHYAVGDYPMSVTVGDINGDGTLDLAVANAGGSSVSLLFGNGNGTFQAAQTFAVSWDPRAVTLGDFDGDTALDLAVANEQNGVDVRLGNGDGTFQTTVSYYVISPLAIAIGDVNNDGNFDLVTAGIALNEISVLLGNGDGSFQTSVDVPVDGIPRAITVADLNGDSRSDISVVFWGSNGTHGVRVLLSQNDGTFQILGDYPTGQHPQGVTAGDFDGDTWPDLAVTNTHDHNVSVLLQGPIADTTTRAIAYQYDGLSRLTGATATPGQVYTYTYDLAGNQTDAWTNGMLTAHHEYNAANQVVGWSYDDAGNLLSDGTTTYTYDALGRLTQRGATSYAYNGDGVLVFDGTTRYTQDLAAPLSQVLQTTQSGIITDYLYGTQRLGALQDSVRTWYLGDGLGSVRQTLSNTGVALGNLNYDPWGQVESGVVPTFGFTGELQDGATSLVYLRARWYSTGSGTFISRDSFPGLPKQPYSLHPYQYGYSNPVLWTDPTGMNPTHRCGKILENPCPPAVNLPPELIPPPPPKGPIPTDPSCPASPPLREPDVVDMGYIEGGYGTAGAIAGGIVGHEWVYDLYDFEYARFDYVGSGKYFTLGASAGAYVGVVTGWSNFVHEKVQRGVENYKGSFWSVSVGASLPAAPIVSIGAQLFGSPDGKMVGWATSVGLGFDKLPVGGSIMASEYSMVEPKQTFHTATRPNYSDAVKFAQFIAGLTTGPLNYQAKSSMIQTVLNNGRKWEEYVAAGGT